MVYLEQKLLRVLSGPNRKRLDARILGTVTGTTFLGNIWTSLHHNYITLHLQPAVNFFADLEEKTGAATCTMAHWTRKNVQAAGGWQALKLWKARILVLLELPLHARK